MENAAVEKKLAFKEGKIVVELGGSYDGDKDGVKSAEAGLFVKVDAVEAIKEVIKAQHNPTLEALLPYAKQIIALVPEKEIA